VSAVDWSRFQKCPVCFAALGKACLKVTGFGEFGPVSVKAAVPHGGRKLRAGYGRG
jgi:hypothetical protein